MLVGSYAQEKCIDYTKISIHGILSALGTFQPVWSQYTYQEYCWSCSLQRMKLPGDSTHGAIDEPPTVGQRNARFVHRLGELEQSRFNALHVEGQQKPLLKVEEMQHPVEGLTDTRLAHPEDQTHVFEASRKS